MVRATARAPPRTGAVTRIARLFPAIGRSMGLRARPDRLGASQNRGSPRRAIARGVRRARRRVRGSVEADALRRGRSGPCPMRRRGGPLPDIGRVVGQAPAVDVDGCGREVVHLDPVGRFAVLVVEGRLVPCEELREVQQRCRDRRHRTQRRAKDRKSSRTEPAEPCSEERPMGGNRGSRRRAAGTARFVPAGRRYCKMRIRAPAGVRLACLRTIAR